MKKKQSFQNRYLNLIRKSLGASFVSWNREGDKYSLKVIVNKETKYYPIEGKPSDVTAKNYLDFLNAVKDGR